MSGKWRARGDRLQGRGRDEIQQEYDWEEFYRWPGMRVLQSSLERHGRKWAVQGRVARIGPAFRSSSRHTW